MDEDGKQPSGNFELKTKTGPDSAMTEIGPGLAVPLPLYLESELPGRTVKMTVDLVDDRIQCVSFEVTAKAGSAVTSDSLRGIPISEIVALAGYQMLWRREVRGGTTALDGPLLPPPGFPDDGPTDEALRFVASFYHLAYALGQPPTKTVQELGLTYATAARWVALARAAGHLSRTEPGRASGKRKTPEG